MLANKPSVTMSRKIWSSTTTVKRWSCYGYTWKRMAIRCLPHTMAARRLI